MCRLPKLSVTLCCKFFAHLKQWMRRNECAPVCARVILTVSNKWTSSEIKIRNTRASIWPWFQLTARHGVKRCHPHRQTFYQQTHVNCHRPNGFIRPLLNYETAAEASTTASSAAAVDCHVVMHLNNNTLTYRQQLPWTKCFVFYIVSVLR